MKINIREATLDDLNILLDFEQQLINVERPMDISLKQHQKINYYDISEFIRSANAEVFVAIVDNEIVGSGYGLIKQNKNYFNKKEHGYVGFMFVKDDYRGKGISKLVLNSIFDWFKTKNISEVRLTVYEENINAIKAYEKVGFEKNLIEMLYNLD